MKIKFLVCLLMASSLTYATGTTTVDQQPVTQIAKPKLTLPQRVVSGGIPMAIFAALVTAGATAGATSGRVPNDVRDNTLIGFVFGLIVGTLLKN